MENYKVKKLIGHEEIEQRVREVASEVNHDYAGKDPILAVVLKGGFVFAADLVRMLDVPFTIEFVGTSSYDGAVSSGDIRITKDLDISITDRHLLLVEDIVDTGLTLHVLCDLFEQRKPRSITIATMLLKDIERPFDLPLGYVGFGVPNKFVVGYGLDYNERYRGLPYIGYIESNTVGE